MEYVTVIEDNEEEVIAIKSERYPVDLVVWNPTVDPQQSGAPVVTRTHVTSYTGRVRIRRPIKRSPRQDTLSVPRRVPKTRGDTNEFISAFWVKGKPKCRKGYTYDFKRKMCRRL